MRGIHPIARLEASIVGLGTSVVRVDIMAAMSLRSDMKIRTKGFVASAGKAQMQGKEHLRITPGSRTVEYGSGTRGRVCALNSSIFKDVLICC